MIERSFMEDFSKTARHHFPRTLSERDFVVCSLERLGSSGFSAIYSNA